MVAPQYTDRFHARYTQYAARHWKKRGRPLLLAARVPEDLIGCHFDGMDVETWVRDFLVDILVVGTRTANADIAAFRHMVKGTPIKIYPEF